MGKAHKESFGESFEEALTRYMQPGIGKSSKGIAHKVPIDRDAVRFTKAGSGKSTRIPPYYRQKEPKNNSGLPQELWDRYKEKDSSEWLMTGERWFYHLGMNLGPKGSSCGPQTVWDDKAAKAVPLLEHPYIRGKVGLVHPNNEVPLNTLMKNGVPFKEEPDYKAWVGLLLDKIKKHNEDLQRAKKLQGIDPMDFAMGSFMGPRISYDNSLREIQLPSSIKEWQDKELESTEEGRKKIGKGALSKLTHQERRVLNLNRPFKEIDNGFLLHEVQVKENEAIYKARELELAAMYKQLQGLRKQNHGATRTDKYLKFQKVYDKMHNEFHAFKEAHLASCKFDQHFYE